MLDWMSNLAMVGWLVAASVLVWLGIKVGPNSIILALNVAVEVPLCYPFWQVRADVADNYQFFFFSNPWHGW